MNDFNSVIDRALSEHQGSCIMSKKSNGKYSLFMPVTNTGELGSAPEQIQKTVIGNMAHSYIQGRKDSPQQSLTYYVHRDNLRLLNEYKGQTIDFLRVFPDFSAVKYSGMIDGTFSDTSIGSAEQGTVTVTITVPEEIVDDCYDLIEDTAIFTNDIPQMVQLVGTEKKEINVSLNPANATVVATSETDDVATASYADGKVTITGVAKGSAIIKLVVSASGYASWTRTIHCIVKDA